jgi:hypothetical protein
MPPPNKRLFIQTIQSVPLWGHVSVPTAVHYDDQSATSAGHEAESLAKDALDVNRDFKVDLGRLKASSSSQKSFRCADGKHRSASVMTKDFLLLTLRQAEKYLAESGISQVTRLLVAEPLNMHAEDNSEWLQNYRANMRSLLEGTTYKGAERIQLTEIDFLPEPFAAFQYYRYGVRSPAVTALQKYCALVLDFGGGTFDVCVIETTRDGDISQSGRSSKPYGASSVPIGGFYVNRIIVEYLLKKWVIPQNQDEQRRFARALAKYYSYRHNQDNFLDLSPEIQCFAENFQRAVFEIETAKLKLCRKVQDWDLGGKLTATEQVLVPESMFSHETGGKLVVFSASEFRDIFEKEIWEKELCPTIRQALDNARQSLGGQPVNVVLLSGGSANIGWVEKLLCRDFEADLRAADIVPLDDYQEVVSKGLAVECARRFFTDGGKGDFESVAYNPLWLLMDIGDTGIRGRRFQPLETTLPDCSLQPGLLLDAATPLQPLIGTPLNWKVKNTGSKPKELRYYFLRSSSQVTDSAAPIGAVGIEQRLNFEEEKIYAPADTQYDSDLKVRLSIRSDGTVEPSFVYKSATHQSGEHKRDGKPFFMDTTTAQKIQHTAQTAYLGLDFGTSNSSLALVTEKTIRTLNERAKHSSWQELAELPARLPHPLSEPLQGFISEHINRNKQADYARQFIEATLTMIFVTALMDLAIQASETGKPAGERIIGDLRQNSAGPIWGRLKQIYSEPRLLKTARLTQKWLPLFEPTALALVDQAVGQIAALKHEKADVDDVEWHDTLCLIGNTAAGFFSEAYFGFFEHVEQKPFSEEIVGAFRVARGKPPFPGRISVALPRSVVQRQPFLFHRLLRLAIPFAPFYVFKPHDHPNDYDHGLLWTWDTFDARARKITYKSCFRMPPLEVSETDPALGPLVGIIQDRFQFPLKTQHVAPVIEVEPTDEK